MVYFILFASAFLSATLFPFGSEALLVYDIQAGYNIYWLLLFATIGNTLGSSVNYFLGLKGEGYIEKKSLVKKRYIYRTKIYFDKYGSFCLLFSWLPIIGDPVTFIAGVLKYDFKKFIFIVLLAKFLRYMFLTITVLYVF
jgi:membrane protein YqaA with SNARE-associated domain